MLSFRGIHSIVVTMDSVEADPYAPPHIHVECEGRKAMVGFDGRILFGALSPKAESKVKKWVLNHGPELTAMWYAKKPVILLQ